MNIPAMWQIPVATLLRGLREEGREEPSIERYLNSDNALSLAWENGVIVKLQPYVVSMCALPGRGDHFSYWIQLGADWVSEVRRLAPKKPAANMAPVVDGFTNACPPAPMFDYSGPAEQPHIVFHPSSNWAESKYPWQERVRFLSEKMRLTANGKPIVRVPVSSDISMLCLEEMLRLLDGQASVLFTNNSGWLFGALDHRAQYDRAFPQLVNCLFARSVLLDSDETLIIGHKNAVYNPGA